jgi:uncharacterized protein YjbI with pentapeptide repeats
MEEFTQTELTSAEDNVYYQLALQGKNTWNRWMRCQLSPEQRKKSGLDEAPYNSSIDLSALARELGLDEIPDASFVYFKDTEFDKRINFVGFVFDRTSFYGSVFNDSVNFSGAIFLGPSDFDGCDFKNSATFTDISACSRLGFSGANFESVAIFSDANIRKADFSNSLFLRAIDFSRTQFLTTADFSASNFFSEADFNNAVFSSSTLFDGAAFKEAPLFHQTTLNQDTSFLGTVYPLRKDVDCDQWSKRAQAWRTLKLKMNSFQSYQDELLFFAKELDARARAESNNWFLFSIIVYNAVCGFGTFIYRPVILLIALWSLSACVYAFYMQAHTILKVAGFSFSNTVPFVGQSRLMSEFAIGAFPVNVLPTVYALSAIQGALSAVLLFLILLGIRNHFRLK